MIRNELVNPSKNDNFSPVCMRLYLTKIIKENQITFVDLEEIGTSEDTLFNLQYIIHNHIRTVRRQGHRNSWSIPANAILPA